MTTTNEAARTYLAATARYGFLEAERRRLCERMAEEEQARKAAEVALATCVNHENPRRAIVLGDTVLVVKADPQRHGRCSVTVAPIA